MRAQVRQARESERRAVNAFLVSQRQLLDAAQEQYIEAATPLKARVRHAHAALAEAQADNKKSTAELQRLRALGQQVQTRLARAQAELVELRQHGDTRSELKEKLAENMVVESQIKRLDYTLVLKRERLRRCVKETLACSQAHARGAVRQQQEQERWQLLVRAEQQRQREQELQQQHEREQPVGSPVSTHC